VQATGRDPTARGRAAAAADEVSRRYGAMIDAVQNDRSLSPDQKAASIRALRDRQKAESRAARRQVLDDDQATMRAVRRSERELFGRQPMTGKDFGL
jgi:hypothetical protein